MTAPGPELVPNPWLGRLGLVALLVVAGLVGYGLRLYFVEPIERGWDQILWTEARALTAHRQTIDAYKAGKVDVTATADAIERRSLPLWTDAVGKSEALKARGLKGNGIDVAIPYFRARERASRLLVEALRANDPVKLEEAKSAWAESERLGVAFEDEPL